MCKKDLFKPPRDKEETPQDLIEMVPSRLHKETDLFEQEVLETKTSGIAKAPVHFLGLIKLPKDIYSTDIFKDHTNTEVLTNEMDQPDVLSDSMDDSVDTKVHSITHVEDSEKKTVKSLQHKEK